METPGSFGEWLKQRRKTLDLTQEELAQRAGCSVFALRKIEGGERRPSKQLAGLLAEALELPDEERPLFIRAARGEVTYERLRAPVPDGKPAGTRLAEHHIPLTSTSLLGRDPELAAMERIFREPQCRLLTLTGMGGIGKTRLALEFAMRQREAFPAGVHFVPLASIHSPELIVPAIAEVMGFTFSGPLALQAQLFAYLSDAVQRPALLVLDNLEHLLGQSSAAAELVAEILLRFSEIKILCTSRERLNLHGEWTYELHGLPLPPSEFVEALEDYSAPALFLQRARQINAGFELGAGDTHALVQICHLVDGIPLALELAAAWTGMLSCHEIAREIEANIGFLAYSMRDIPERHRSLKATFDHSWRLLKDAEQEALSRLSVFHGGFDRRAAESIAGAGLPVLSSLISKSLLKKMEGGRYDLHEVIRQYASLHLQEDAELHLAACDAHCAYYLELVAAREKSLKSVEQQDAMQELTRELDNIRAAWVWGIERKQFPLLTASVRSLGWMFEVGGLIREGIGQLELLVQALRVKPGETASDRALGAALIQQGLLNFRTGEFLLAMELYRDGITLLRSAREPGLLADALIFSGTLLHLNGDYLEARALIEEGLGYAREAKDPWFTAYGIYNLGHIDSMLGEYQKGYDEMQEGLQAWRELGDPHSISLGLNFLVNTQIQLGRHEEARAAMLESISLCERTKNRWGMATAWRYLGLAELAAGQYADARACFDKSLETFGEYFRGWDIAQTLIYLGETDILSGKTAEGEVHLQEALRLGREIHSKPLMLEALTGLASLQMTANTGRAAGWLKLVISHPAGLQETKDRACRLMEEMPSSSRRKALPEMPCSLEELADEILRQGPG